MKSARKRKKVIAATAQLSTVPRQESAEWVKQMQSYYRQSGSYRAADVERVLGDARETVQAVVTDQAVLACGVIIK